MTRIDISEYLIHFTKGSSYLEAYERLKIIIYEQRLIGTNTFIKGGFNCVCFSEAPVSCLEDGLVNPDYYSKYSPFGIMVSKTWLFSKGGRAVIYQPENEFYNLSESHKWRHVTYEPNRVSPIDFSWEREWRIQCQELYFTPQEATLIVPDENWASYLIREHENDQDWEVQKYNMLLGRPLGEVFRESFEWHILTLK